MSYHQDITEIFRNLYISNWYTSINPDGSEELLAEAF